jgi:predicted dehydrogenase
LAALQAPAFLRGQNLNSRLNLGIIGAAGKGQSDMYGAAGFNEKQGTSTENVVAICDVDLGRARKAQEKFPKARLFQDYRRMLDEVREIEACTISTPDHHHAPAAIRAMRLKKHVYVQKPLTHSIYEARTLQKVARKYKVATLMGNQGHSGEDVRRFCEMIWAGAIGPVREVHAWTNRPIWPQGINRPAGEKPVPADLDWDVWLGPAPVRPFNDGYHPFAWRGFWDFGTGALGDMACHILDPACWALKLSDPKSVEATSLDATAESAPKWAIITYQFPARGSMPPLKLVWYDGGKMPSNELLGIGPKDKFMDNGSLFIGEKGKMVIETYGGNPRFTADSPVKEFATPPKTLERSPGHYKEWVDACKGLRKNTGSNFDYACPFTEIVLLGNLAVRTGTRVEWDAAKMRARNVDVSHLVKRKYRKGWEV